MNDFVIIKGVLTKYTGNDADVVIPDGITEIGERAFDRRDRLISVTIPESVTKIGENAFSGCSGLTSVTIPDSVTSIGWSAFDGCSSLTSVTIPGSVTEIDRSAFWGCSSLTSVTIPDGVTKIGSRAFENCGSLTSITIPESITIIYDYAFGRCGSLTSVNASEEQFEMVWSVLDSDQKTNIAYNCLKIGTVYNIVKGFIKRKKDDVLNRIIQNDDVKALEIYLQLFKKPDIGTLDKYIEKAQNAVNIKAYLIDYKAKNYTNEQTEAFYDDQTEKEIGFKERTLAEWRKIFKISDKDGKRYISGYKADDAMVIIPSNIAGMPVYGIADNAFKNCTTLTSVTIPGSVMLIGNSAFYGCNSLISVTIQDGVTSIDDRAFFMCSNLTSVTIPGSVTLIGRDAFLGCSSISSITIPDSVTNIGTCAFHFCGSLTNITVDENNKNYSSQDGVLFSKDKTTLIKCPAGNERTEYTIPDSVTSIGDQAFSWCSILTSMTIPNSVTSIGDNAFSGCIGLTSITIPDSVTKIGQSAFSWCDSLASITIPESVTKIGGSAFGNCTIIASKGSYAYKYAIKNNINVKEL